MNTYSTIRVEHENLIGRVTLCRPSVCNTFNHVMISEMHKGFSVPGNDRNIRAVVLTGEGKAFCSGGDIYWMRRVLDHSYEENYTDSLSLAHLMRRMHELPKPLVGRINGPAIRGGTGLVAVCNIGIASSRAIFSFSEVKMGLIPACICPYVLKRVGERYAREYFLTGKRLAADEAEYCGLVNRSVPVEALDAVVDRYLESLISNGPLATAMSKQMISKISEMSLDRAGLQCPPS